MFDRIPPRERGYPSPDQAEIADDDGEDRALWMDTTVAHLVRGGIRLKTVPSRLTAAQLQQLLAGGGRIAGPSPIKGDGTGGDPVEVDRLVNACGTVGLAGRQHRVGYHLAGQRVTVRLDGAIMQILDQDHTLLRTLPNPLTPHDRSRLRDARVAGPCPRVPDRSTVQRRVSCRGAIMVAGQRIQVGYGHAGLTVTVAVMGNAFHVYDGDELLAQVADTSTKPIARFKARKPEPPRPQART